MITLLEISNVVFNNWIKYPRMILKKLFHAGVYSIVQRIYVHICIIITMSAYLNSIHNLHGKAARRWAPNLIHSFSYILMPFHYSYIIFIHFHYYNNVWNTKIYKKYMKMKVSSLDPCAQNSKTFIFIHFR